MERSRTGAHGRLALKSVFVKLTISGSAPLDSGNMTDEAIRENIRQPDGTKLDDGGDNFRVTPS